MTPRERIRKTFDQKLRMGEFLVGAAVGAGSTAKAAERGGADFLLALSAGRVRVMGAGSVASMFPIHNAMDFVESFAVQEMLPQCSTPILFGLSVSDPREDTSVLLDRVLANGFPGVVNWPTSVCFPEGVQSALDIAGRGFSRELEMLRAAGNAGLFTAVIVSTPDQAEQAAASGVDLIDFNFGWNVGGSLGHQSDLTLKEIAGVAKAVVTRIKRHSQDAYLLLAGGPIRNVDDLITVYKNAPIDGYVGGSTLDRIPIEQAIEDRTIRFKSSPIKVRQISREEKNLAGFGEAVKILGSTPAILRATTALKRLCENVGPIGLVGEESSGRQAIAEAIHNHGGGSISSLAVLDAKEMQTKQLAIRMFGRASKATTQLMGILETRSIKTVVIRQVNLLPKDLQKKIARFVSEGRFRPIGGRMQVRQGLRLIFIYSETEETLEPELGEILRNCRVDIPAIRDRADDLLELLNSALRNSHRDANYSFSPAALRTLQRHSWPNNFRELNAFVSRLVRSTSAGEIDQETVSLLLDPDTDRHRRPGSEREIIIETLWRHGFHKGKAASSLGITRRTLYNRMKKLEIDA
ncbi:MAG: phosphoenolpyruvate hydrolase family protein [Rhizobiaceae bacterium]